MENTTIPPDEDSTILSTIPTKLSKMLSNTIAETTIAPGKTISYDPEMRETIVSSAVVTNDAITAAANTLKSNIDSNFTGIRGNIEELKDDIENQLVETTTETIKKTRASVKKEAKKISNKLKNISNEEIKKGLEQLNEQMTESRKKTLSVAEEKIPHEIELTSIPPPRQPLPESQKQSGKFPFTRSPYTNPDRIWHQKHEEFLIRLHAYCNELMDLYHAEYVKNERLLCKFRTPQIILSSLTAFLSVSNTGYIPEVYNKYVSLFCGVLNLCMSVVATIEGFKKVGEKTNMSRNTFSELRQLSNDITYILSIPVELRDDGGSEIVREFYDRFQSTMKSSITLKKYSRNIFELREQLEKLHLVHTIDDKILAAQNQQPQQLYKEL